MVVRKVGDDEGTSNPIGYVLIFSFLSTIFLFFGILFFAVLNNYALGELYSLVNMFALDGTIPSSFVNIADNIASSIPQILPVIDFIWFGAFVSMIVSTLIYSYNRKRANYFSLLTMLVLGIIIFIWIGSYFIQMTDWFIAEIFVKVLPTFSTYTPIFNWYLNNLAVINIILVVVNVIANFVDLDFSKFFKRKEGESFDEI